MGILIPEMHWMPCWYWFPWLRKTVMFCFRLGFICSFVVNRDSMLAPIPNVAVRSIRIVNGYRLERLSQYLKTNVNVVGGYTNLSTTLSVALFI